VAPSSNLPPAYACGERGWEIILDGKLINFTEISAGYLRRPVAPIVSLGVVGEVERRYCASEWREALTAALWSIGHRWLNPPLAIHAAENKPRQLALAISVGFNIPETIVTNCVDEVSKFIRGGTSVGKPLRSALLGGVDEERVIFTSRIADIPFDDETSVSAAPFIIQREISKRFDLRVTVVGEIAFATEIDSQVHRETETDWRRGARIDLAHRVHELPSEINAKCIQLTRLLNLRFAAIDLVMDRGGQYWFLEINLNGQWAWIMARTGQPIAEAIVAELQRIAAS
jgi:glutathione synthase/RimK-type ligase-like ATP-grasp enzyme